MFHYRTQNLSSFSLSKAEAVSFLEVGKILEQFQSAVERNTKLVMKFASNLINLSTEIMFMGLIYLNNSTFLSCKIIYNIFVFFKRL